MATSTYSNTGITNVLQGTLSSLTTPAPAAAALYSGHVTDAGAHSLKRPADSEPDSIDNDTHRKRMREDMDAAHGADAAAEAPHAIDGHALADDLAQELQCGCCSELVYKPVIVSPCEHFFCGRCVLLPFD